MRAGCTGPGVPLLSSRDFDPLPGGSAGSVPAPTGAGAGSAEEAGRPALDAAVSSPSSPSLLPPPGMLDLPADPWAVLAAAAARTARHLASFEVKVRSASRWNPEGTITEARGQVDFAVDWMTLRVLDAVLDGEEVYANGPITYARFGQDPGDAFPEEKEWVRFESLEQAEDAASTASTLLLLPAGTDPRWYLAAIRDLAADVRRMGPGRVHAKEAVRYRVRLVAGEPARRSGGGLALRPTALDDPRTKAWLSVWVTDAGIARLDLTARYPLGATGEAERGSSQVRIDLHGIGPAVPVKPPPAAAVLSPWEFDRCHTETEQKFGLRRGG